MSPVPGPPEQSGGTSAENSTSLRPLRRTGAFLSRAHVTWRQALEGSATASLAALLVAGVGLAVALRRRRRGSQ